MKHAELIKKAIAAIKSVFSDTSVDPKTTYESLKELWDEIDVLIDALEMSRK